MKKKIVYIAESIGGGVRRHLVDLLENLNKDYYEIYVIYGNRTDCVFLENICSFEEKGIVFFEIKSMVREISFEKDLKACKYIYNLLKKVNPDIVHCHSSKAGALGRMCAKFLGIKQVYYTPHAYAFMDPNISKNKRFIYLKLEKYLSKITNKVIHVSEGEEQEAIKNHVVNPKKSKVILNGIDEKVELINNSRKHRDFVIGTVARMDDQKNPMEFIKIAELVINNYPRVKFVYVGDGIRLNEIKDYVNNSACKNNISILGFHDQPNIILQTFDLFLTTSLYEGLPYALIEALAFGKPIIATDVVGNNEVVNDKYNGYLYSQGNIQEAAEIIEMLITNKREMKRLSANSCELYDRKYRLDRMIEAYESIYEVH